MCRGTRNRGFFINLILKSVAESIEGEVSLSLEGREARSPGVRRGSPSPTATAVEWRVPLVARPGQNQVSGRQGRLCVSSSICAP